MTGRPGDPPDPLPAIRGGSMDGLMFENMVTLRSGTKAGQERVGAFLVDFVPGGSDLGITFESGSYYINRGDRVRDGWGLPFLMRRGYSVVAVKTAGRNCYMGQEFLSWIRSAEVAEFFSRFRRQVFMGGSMGGFAAITFARLCPGSVVIAHNPQSTLDPSIVPWDKRFPDVPKLNWANEFGDAATAVPLLQKLYLIYDPFHVDDNRHAARLDGPNAQHLKVPFVGHQIPVWLAEMGILSEVTEQAVAGTLTAARFAKLARRRKQLPRYRETIARFIGQPADATRANMLK